MSCNLYVHNDPIGGSKYIAGTQCDGSEGSYTLTYGQSLCMNNDLPISYECGLTISGECLSTTPTPTPTPNTFCYLTGTEYPTSEFICPFDGNTYYNIYGNLTIVIAINGVPTTSHPPYTFTLINENFQTVTITIPDNQSSFTYTFPFKIYSVGTPCGSSTGTTCGYVDYDNWFINSAPISPCGISPTPTRTPTNTPTPTATPAPSFDADAAAYLAAVIAAGGTGITSTVSAATNTLVTSLKSAGVWTLIDAIYPFLGGNSAGTKFNAKDPQDTNAAYRMVFNGSWTFSASGVVPTAKNSSNYGNSFWSPYGVGGNRNITHHYYRYINQVNSVTCSYAGVAVPYTMMGACAPLEWFDGGGAISVGGVVAGTAGYSQAISRTASNVTGFYRKLTGGVWTLFNTISTVATQSSNTMYIGAINGANFPEQMRYATLSYGQGLTTVQMASLDSIITTFNTTLGRNF